VEQELGRGEVGVSRGATSQRGGTLARPDDAPPSHRGGADQLVVELKVVVAPVGDSTGVGGGAQGAGEGRSGRRSSLLRPWQVF
jgi:hypothetical protein